MKKNIIESLCNEPVTVCEVLFEADVGRVTHKHRWQNIKVKVK
jgi:hypothetical protein